MCVGVGVVCVGKAVGLGEGEEGEVNGDIDGMEVL